MKTTVICLSLFLLFDSQGYLVFCFVLCLNRPRTPNKRELNKQFENRGVSANTECLNHKVVQLERAGRLLSLHSSHQWSDGDSKSLSDSLKDTESATGHMPHCACPTTRHCSFLKSIARQLKGPNPCKGRVPSEASANSKMPFPRCFLTVCSMLPLQCRQGCQRSQTPASLEGSAFRGDDRSMKNEVNTALSNSCSIKIPSPVWQWGREVALSRC